LQHASRHAPVTPLIPNRAEEDNVFQFIRGLRTTTATHLTVQGVSTLDAAIIMAARVGGLAERAGGAAAPSNEHTAHGGAHGGAPALNNIEGLDEDAEDTKGIRAELHQLLNAMREQRYGGGRGGGGGSGGLGGFGGHRGGGGAGGSDRPHGRPVIRGMTDAQVLEYMENEKCFACGNKGHRSRQCPNKGKRGQEGGAGAGRPSPSN